MNPEIAVIAPDKELFTLVKEIVKEFSEPILIEEGYLDEGVEVAYKLEKLGIKVLVSRGRTTTKLRSTSLPMPVIDIPITEYDIIRLLDQARRIDNRVAVIGFDVLVNGAEVIGPILDVEVTSFLAQSKDDINEAIKKVTEMGISVVVGAKLAVESAEIHRIQGLLLKSQKPAVLSALKEAIKVLHALKKEREWGERIQTVLDSIQDGIVSVNAEGVPMYYNKIADRVLGISHGKYKDKEKVSQIKKSGILNAIKRGEKWVGEVRKLNNAKYVCNLNPIVINEQILGATIIFQELQQLEIIEQKVRRNLYQKGLIAKHNFSDMVYQDTVMEKVINRAKKYSKVDSTVTIEGESGTGKEIFAQSIHNESSRSGGPFVAINCAALPENLLESELFGYVEGAFTGAKRGGKPGLFELAHNGTLFLDEIGELPLVFQARLLRVLEERRIMRIGDDKVIPVDVRIISATNRDLSIEVKNSKFRSDLFYRINVLKLNLPPLRNRIEDIPILIKHFLQLFDADINGSNQILITKEAVELLCAYKYPGNIRELRNIIVRLVVSTRGECIDIDHVREVIDIDQGFINSKQSRELIQNSKKSLVDREEIKLILKVLEESGGNKAQAARKLGISKTTLWRKLKKL